MIYMATHNNLALAGSRIIAQMRRAKLSENVRVLVQQSTPVRTVRREIGANPERVADLGQVDSGAPETVIDFVRWARERAPAERYALVFWSHGSGWEPSEMERLAQQHPAATPVTQVELAERGPRDEGRQVLFSSTMRELLSRPTPVERAVAFDDGSGHSLDTIEIGWTMADAREILGQPVHLLGMNACLMSAVEVAYQVRDSAGVYVASEELMPVQSWPYDDILDRLSDRPDMDADALGQMIVERYCAYFRTHSLPWKKPGLPPGVTLTAVHPGKTARLVDAVGSLAVALRADIGAQLQGVWDAHRKAHAFRFRLHDLASFARTLVEHHKIAPVSAAAARDVLAALDDPALVLAHRYTAPVYGDTGGLATYLMVPEPGKSLSPYYAETDYARATGWGDFLAAYHDAI
jgi:hypothetical protein